MIDEAIPYQRGQIYYVTSDPTKPSIGAEIWSDRPALIVSNNTTNNTNSTITVVYLSTSRKKQASPLHVLVTSGARKAFALCEQLHSVDKSRLHQRLGEILPEEQKEIDKALCFSLAIDAESYRSTFKKWEHYIQEYHLPVIDENESIAASIKDTAVKNLRTEIEILKNERDGWKSIAESKQKLLDCIREDQILP